MSRKCIDCKRVTCVCIVTGWAIRTHYNFGRLWLAEFAPCPEAGKPSFTDQWEKRYVYKFRAFAEEARRIVGNANLVRITRRFSRRQSSP